MRAAGSQTAAFAAIGAAAAVFGLFFYWYKPVFIAAVDMEAADAFFKLRGESEPPARVVIVAVDERSINELGRWPWPRTVTAELVRALVPARVAAFDMVFSEPTDPEDDAELGAAVEGAGNVVLGFFFREDSTEEPSPEALELISRSAVRHIRTIDGGTDAVPWIGFPGAELNIPAVAAGAAGFGTFNILAQADGYYRSAHLLYRYRDAVYPSLAVEALRLYLGGDLVVHTAPYGIDSISIGDRVAPLDEEGALTLNFYGPGGAFTTYSAVDVIEGRVGAEELADRLVFVGVTEKAVYDIRNTPVDPVFPGVEIHATVAGNVLQGRYIVRDSGVVLIDLLVIVLLPVLFALLLSRAPNTTVSLALFVVAFAAVVAVNFHLFSTYSLRTSMVFQALPLIACYLATEAYRNLVVERKSRFIRRAFSTYVSPQLLSEILRDPEKLKLGGEKRDVTVLFSDIRGFTSLSERLKPDELVALLNAYLSPMTRIVLDEEGMLDKYIGDAVMAIFNAPVPVKDHQLRACNAAVSMVEKLAELNAAWKRQGLPELDIGIGVNCGEAVVGNMGAELKFDYTAIGDAVNLASRLEGMNKLYGTRILISDSVHAAVNDRFLAREIDLVRVKGKARPCTVYELMDRGGGAEHKRALARLFAEALELYRARCFDDAREAFAAVVERFPGDGPSLLYMDRCDQYRKKPPPADWDGVFTATTK
ncbi:MAG TPA: adenylate/guanylate cyclase domain-containing protein [Deltaproteobacteria bacterium]|nr:adenylate/guanylate cyclase domain-containing protein [Deltaproteobacteria bacterium]